MSTQINTQANPWNYFSGYQQHLITSMLMDAESSLHEKLTKEYDRIKGLDAEIVQLKAENKRLKAENTRLRETLELRRTLQQYD